MIQLNCHKILKNILKLCFIVCLSQLTAQNNPHLKPDFKHINHDANFIQFYKDSSAFEKFYQKLDTLAFKGKGRINIIHVGGSHIQADIWSNQLRTHFFKLAPGLNGGRGFLFPYHLAKTNNPSTYKVKYSGEWEGFRNSVDRHDATWGLSGVTATTHEPSDIQFYFTKKKELDFKFNKVRVFYQMDSTSFNINYSGKKHYTTQINEKIGYKEFNFKEPMDTLDFKIAKSNNLQTKFSIYGMEFLNDDPGIVYHSIGVNGASTKSYLRCDLFEQHLQAIPPDLVIFSIGINDAYDSDFCPNCFEENYTILIEKMKSVAPNTAILFTTNNDSYYKRRYPNRRAEEVRRVMQKLAKKHNAGVWDMYKVMGELGSIKIWEQYKLAKKDKIHFTREGYKIVGDLLFDAFMKGYKNHHKN